MHTTSDLQRRALTLSLLYPLAASLLAFAGAMHWLRLDVLVPVLLALNMLAIACWLRLPNKQACHDDDISFLSAG